MGKLADELNKTSWWILQEKIDHLEKVIFELKRGYTATGFEGWPCPGCTYVDGVFIKTCELHKRIQDLESRLELRRNLSKDTVARYLNPFDRWNTSEQILGENDD